jgi:hypothetical protein
VVPVLPVMPVAPGLVVVVAGGPGRQLRLPGPQVADRDEPLSAHDPLQ